MQLHSVYTFRARRTSMWIAMWIGCVALPIQAASTIPFKMVAGRPCASGSLHGGGKSIPANIVIDLGVRGSLLVHKNTAKMLQLGPDSPAELRFGDVVLSGLKAFSVDARDLEELSRDHAEELNEVPAVAVLGLPALTNYVIRLDIGAGRLELFAPGEAPSIEPVEGKAAVLDYTEEAYGVWLVAHAGDDFKLRTRFMTSTPDTIIEAIAADLAGSAAGAIDELTLGGINIARFVAFRPEDLSGMPDPKPDLALGTNLLASFRVTIDPGVRRISFEQIREPQFPEHERAFYIARASGEADAVEQFLQAHADSRLAVEASDLLLKLRLESEPADVEATVRAMRMRAAAAAENRRAALMVMLADQLITSDKPELAEKALAIGEESAAADLNGIAAFQISARRGQVAMARGDLAGARRFLVAAAFGAPRDPLINLLLGELYERSGKPLRAWSRYLQAALDRSAPQEAMVALDRINRDPAFRAKFSMADAEQLLEGRMLEFHPAERYAEESPEAAPPVKLVEFFNCVDGGGTCAPELAFQGLSEYFEEAPVAFVQYHVNAPRPDPLATRASDSRARFYQTTTAPAGFFDGQGPLTAEGSDRQAAAVYQEYLKAARSPESSDTGAGETETKPAIRTEQAWRLSGALTLKGDELSGTVLVDGPPSAEDVRLHAVLCERSVMLPGANGVMLHRYVARALLSPEQGFALATGATRRIELASSFDRIVKDVEAEVAAAEKALDVTYTMRPTFVDRRALVVVIFLQNAKTRGVLEACSIAVRVPTTQPSASSDR